MIDVDKLGAGCELDALVAEKVMGWKATSYAGKFVEWLDASGKSTCWYSGGSESYPEWNPSTDIAAAWQIVEHMIQRPEFKQNYFGWDLRFGIEPPNGDGLTNGIGAHFGRAFHRPDPWPGSYWATGDERMPIAICKAALKAVGAVK